MAVENNGQINMKSGKILIDSCSAVAARNNGIINISGGEINTERTAITLMDEFRSSKIGRITLERYSKEELPDA